MIIKYLVNLSSSIKRGSFLDLSVKWSILSLFMVYSVYFKTYCHYQAVNLGDQFSLLLLINLSSFLFSLIFILIKSPFLLRNIEFWPLMLSLFRGVSSFFSYFLYWNYAIRNLVPEQTIFAESMTEVLKEMVLFAMYLRSGDTTFVVHFVVLIIHLYKIQSLSSNFNVKQLKSDKTIVNVYNESSLMSYYAVFLILIPRALIIAGDVVYSWNWVKGGDPILDSCMTSLITTVTTYVYYFYIRRYQGYRQEIDYFNWRNFLALMAKSETRVASNYLISHENLDFQLSLDKFSMFLYKVTIEMINGGLPLGAFAATCLTLFKSPARMYLVDAFSLLIKSQIINYLDFKKK